MDCRADHVQAPSWWVGLDRDQFQRAIAAHASSFRQQKRAFHDYVGAILMRDAWEPRRDPRRIERGV